MSEDYLLHLNKQHAESHSKYVYFLLAATGAALGYALQKLDASAYTDSAWLGLVAIFFWLGSFFCGCKHVTTIQSAIHSNYQLVQIKSGVHPLQPRSQEEMQIAWEVTSGALKNKSNRAQFYFRAQFWLLAAGVLLFAAWRILMFVGAFQSAP